MYSGNLRIFKLTPNGGLLRYLVIVKLTVIVIIQNLTQRRQRKDRRGAKNTFKAILYHHAYNRRY